MPKHSVVLKAPHDSVGYSPKVSDFMCSTRKLQVAFGRRRCSRILQWLFVCVFNRVEFCKLTMFESISRLVSRNGTNLTNASPGPAVVGQRLAVTGQILGLPIATGEPVMMLVPGASSRPSPVQHEMVKPLEALSTALLPPTRLVPLCNSTIGLRNAPEGSKMAPLAALCP